MCLCLVVVACLFQTISSRSVGVEVWMALGVDGSWMSTGLSTSLQLEAAARKSNVIPRNVKVACNLGSG